MSVRMIALKDFQYAGKRVKSGAEFDARGRMNAPGTDATVLKAIGHAKEKPAEEHKPEPEAPAVPQSQQPVYQTRVMTAEPPAEVPQTPPLITKSEALQDDDQPADPLEDKDIEELRAIAESMGLYVHHRAGAATVRRAIREAQESAAE